MPLGLHELYTPDLGPHGADDLSQHAVVDIVAIHGLAENSTEAWAHQESGTVWLRDLLPQNIPNARVLTFDYDASPSSFSGPDFVEKVQSYATTLVADLEGERNLNNVSERPIIFVCHGLGGIIVKSALTHSASRTSRFTSHLHAVYVSTFAILFFGTPHDHIDVGKWLFTSSPASTRQRPQKDAPPSVTKHALEVVSNQFVPLMKKIHIYLFWEGLKTKLAEDADFMVEPTSAAPFTYDTERCGILDSNHAGMTRFHISHPAYRTVIAALMKYCRSAPTIISYRWKEARISLQHMRKSEASELTGLLLDIPDKGPLFMGKKNDPAEVDWQHEHYYPPCPVSIDFIGQEKVMKTLQRAFNPGQHVPSIGKQKRFVVHGIGGSGKTQVSAKYAQENRNCYWAIFTIVATSSESAKEGFRSIGRIGGLAATEDSGKHFLSQARKPWLLIIDNADKRDMNFESLVPPGEMGHILVTTRSPNLRRQGNVGSMELRGLKKLEALQLLLKVAGIHPPWDFSTERTGHEITKALGYLALAVTQAGNSVFNKLCSLQEYLRFFQRFREARQKRKRESTSDGENTDIYSAFDFSFENIVSRDTIPRQDAVEILNIVSFYHFDHIRVDIFAEGINLKQEQRCQRPRESVHASFLDGLVSRLKPPPALPRFLKDSAGHTDPLCVREALAELYASSLITYSEDARSFSLHPLVHAWARDRIPLEERSLWAIIAFNTLMASIPLPSIERVEHDPHLRRDLLPHLNECLEACPPGFKEFRDLSFGKFRQFMLPFQPTLLLHLREMIQNTVKCGLLFAETGFFSKSAFHLSLAKESLVKLAGPADAKTTAIMLGLAGVYWGLGRLEEAIDLQKQVVTSRRKVLGPDHRETLKAMDSLGYSFWLNGQYVEALQLQQYTAETMGIRLGEDDDDTLEALDHLGVTLGSWHQYAESRDTHQKVLTTRKQSLEEGNLKVLETKKNLAMALLDLKQLKEAKSLMEEVYEGRKTQSGKEHPYTLWALCYLAKINIEEGQLQQAEDVLTEGIAAAKRGLGENHLGVLVGCGELARVYARQGRLEEAVGLTLDTVAKVKKFRGAEHPDYAHGMWKLGQLWEKCQEWTKAIDAYQIALEATERRLTAEHPLHKIISNRITSLTEGPHVDAIEKAAAANDTGAAGVGEPQIKALQPTQTW